MKVKINDKEVRSIMSSYPTLFLYAVFIAGAVIGIVFFVYKTGMLDPLVKDLAGYTAQNERFVIMDQKIDGVDKKLDNKFSSLEHKVDKNNELFLDNRKDILILKIHQKDGDISEQMKAAEELKRMGVDGGVLEYIDTIIVPRYKEDLQKRYKTGTIRGDNKVVSAPVGVIAKE